MSSLGPREQGDTKCRGPLLSGQSSADDIRFCLTFIDTYRSAHRLHRAFGYIYIRLGEYEKARPHFEAAEPFRNDPYVGRVSYFALGLSDCARALLTNKDEKQRDAKRALLLAEKAAEIAKHASPAIMDTLALAQFENGKVAEAVQTQEKAISLFPGRYSAVKFYEMRLRKWKAALKKTQ